jgi:hypothetical protein
LKKESSMHAQHDHTEPPSQPDRAEAGDTCSCERPLPHVRAERKWAARTYCDRCGLPLRLTWR